MGEAHAADGRDVATRAREHSARGSATRQDIVGAARVVFARLGYGGTRLEDVAAAAGTSRTTLYHYFTSRRELFVEIGRAATVAFRHVLDVARAVPTDWSLDDLGRLIDAYLAYLDEHGAVIVTWTQATWGDPELRDLGLSAQQWDYATIGRELARLRGTADVDPAHEAIAFLGMCDRLWYFAREGGAGAIADDDLRDVLLTEAAAILRRQPLDGRAGPHP